MQKKFEYVQSFEGDNLMIFTQNSWHDKIVDIQISQNL